MDALARETDRRGFLGGLAGGALAVAGLSAMAPAAAANEISVPLVQHFISQPLTADGTRLEIYRDYVCFGEGPGGERTTYKELTFDGKVIHTEVFLSGFNMWYPGGRNDHAVTQLRVDAWVASIGERNPQAVSLKFMYVLADQDPRSANDRSDACIGYTVVAITRRA